MVNTNVIISVSAVLVAMLLTIVSLMRQDGDPTDNYSVSVTGSIEREGTSYPADMYFCTGDDCQFYGGVREGQFTPGYFSLVGFNDGTNSYVTEHTVGKTFVYDSSGNLVDCRSSEKEGKQELSQKMSSMKESFKGDDRFVTLLELDGTSSKYTMTNYVMNANPSTDSPSVIGLGVPPIAACKAIWDAEDEALMDEYDEEDDEEDDEERRNLLNWDDDKKAKIDARHMVFLADWAYDGNGLNKKKKLKGFDKVAECEKKNAVARFAVKKPTVVLAYAGTDTDEIEDIIMDMDSGRIKPVGKLNGDELPPNVGKYAKGYYDYTMLIHDCVLRQVNKLEEEGKKLDYVTGHSLGGAAALIFLDLSGTKARAVTFGQPAHKVGGKKMCKNNARRFFHEKDIVASNIFGSAKDLTFDTSHSYRCYEKSRCIVSALGICITWWTDYKVNKSNGKDCGRKAVGSSCSWVVDCLYNSGYHNLSSYQKYGLTNYAMDAGS